jgi:hypothetical protein
MILLSLLAQDLLTEDFTHIDLTPGAKTWKDDFANDWYEGQRVEFYGHYRTVAKETGKRQLVRLARSLLMQAGIEPAEAKKQAQLLKSTIQHGPKALQQKVSGTSGVRVFRIELSSSVSSIGPAIQTMQTSTISALLDLAGIESSEVQGSLLFDALKRYERGASDFAHTTEGAQNPRPLTYLSWLHLPPNKFVAPPPTVDHAWSEKMVNLCDHFAFDTKKDAILVVSYENDLDEDPVSVLTPALNQAREAGLQYLYIAASAQHQTTIRWLAARAQRIQLAELNPES